MMVNSFFRYFCLESALVISLCNFRRGARALRFGSEMLSQTNCKSIKTQPDSIKVQNRAVNFDEVLELPRDSHNSIINQRDWGLVSSFWQAVVQGRADLPEGWKWTGGIGPAANERVNERDTRERRKTYFASVAYFGPNFYGFQFQKNQDVRTVAGVIREGIARQTETGAPVYVAGRTDRGVSATAQVFHFITWENIDEQNIRAAINSLAIDGDINVLKLQRVPRRWHSNFSAKWRRYVYLFPLQHQENSDHSQPQPQAFDIDVMMVDKMLKNLEGKTMSYFSFAYGPVRQSQQGGTDICILHKARAAIIQIPDLRSSDAESPVDTSVMAIELIGNRFLQRMVRILVSTVVREVLTGNRNPRILEDIAVSKIRSRAALPAPPEGLSMAGVGYIDYEKEKVDAYIR